MDIALNSNKLFHLFQIDRSNRHIFFWLNLVPIFVLYVFRDNFSSAYHEYNVIRADIVLHFILFSFFLIYSIFWYIAWLYKKQVQLAGAVRFERQFLYCMFWLVMVKLVTYGLIHYDMALGKYWMLERSDMPVAYYLAIFNKNFSWLFNLIDWVYMIFSYVMLSWFVYRSWTVSKNLQALLFKQSSNFNFLFLYFLIFPISFYSIRKLIDGK